MLRKLFYLAVFLAIAAACNPAPAPKGGSPPQPEPIAAAAPEPSPSQEPVPLSAPPPREPTSQIPMPQATPTPTPTPPNYDPIPPNTEELRRRAASVPRVTPQGGGPETSGMPPGGRVDLSKTIFVTPVPRPTLSPQDRNASLAALLADPTLGPQLAGKKYRVLKNVPAKLMPHMVTQDLLRTDPTLVERQQDLSARARAHPCLNDKPCGGLVVFNYTDNHPVEAIVDLQTGKVILSTVTPMDKQPTLTLEEQELAKAIALASLASSEVSQKAAGRPVAYFGFQGTGGSPGPKGFRGATFILKVGDPAAPDEYLWVEVDLRDEKVFQVVRRVF